MSEPSEANAASGLELSQAMTALLGPLSIVMDRGREFVVRPEVQAGLERVARGVVLLVDTVESNNSPGYAPYSMAYCGMERLQALWCARVVQTYGPQLAEERNYIRRHISPKMRRFAGAASDRFLELAEDLWSEPLLGAVLENVSLGDLASSFGLLLRQASGGDLEARERLRDLCGRIAPSLKRGGGRPLSAVSVTHEVFLKTLEELSRPRRYTVREGDTGLEMVDPATHATRTEFGLARFHPQASARRVSKQHGRRSGARRRS